MKKNTLAFIFFCLTAGLLAQPFDGGANFPPNPRGSGGQSNRGSRPNYKQVEQKEEKPLDPRSPSNKLKLKSNTYRHLRPQETKVGQSSNNAKPSANDKPVLLPLPVSGPGNPLAKPTIEYAPMPAGKKIFECSHCQYIYYTSYMPDITNCEKPGLTHEWHLIGLKGTVWYRCINCNTHVCCSKVPIRSHCTLESKHIWEVVGQLSSEQQKIILEENLD